MPEGIYKDIITNSEQVIVEPVELPDTAGDIVDRSVWNQFREIPTVTSVPEDTYEDIITDSDQVTVIPVEIPDTAGDITDRSARSHQLREGVNSNRNAYKEDDDPTDKVTSIANNLPGTVGPVTIRAEDIEMTRESFEDEGTCELGDRVIHSVIEQLHQGDHGRDDREGEPVQEHDALLLVASLVESREGSRWSRLVQAQVEAKEHKVGECEHGSREITTELVLLQSSHLIHEHTGVNPVPDHGVHQLMVGMHEGQGSSRWARVERRIETQEEDVDDEAGSLGQEHLLPGIRGEGGPQGAHDDTDVLVYAALCPELTGWKVFNFYTRASVTGRHSLGRVKSNLGKVIESQHSDICCTVIKEGLIELLASVTRNQLHGVTGRPRLIMNGVTNSVELAPEFGVTGKVLVLHFYEITDDVMVPVVMILHVQFINPVVAQAVINITHEVRVNRGITSTMIFHNANNSNIVDAEKQLLITPMVAQIILDFNHKARGLVTTQFYNFFIHFSLITTGKHLLVRFVPVGSSQSFRSCS